MGRDSIDKILKRALDEDRNFLYEYEAFKIAESLGIPVPKHMYIPLEDIDKLNPDEIGFNPPYVLKIVSPKALHKSDVGGVVLGVSRDYVVEEAKKLVSNVGRRVGMENILGVVVEEMVDKGVETIVGYLRDPQFGPAVMFGLGGVFVEIYRDVSFRLAPLNREEALEMIRDVKAYKILSGYRGGEKYDVDAIADVIVKIGGFGSSYSLVKEVDVNPLIVYPRGCVAVDVRIILGE